MLKDFKEYHTDTKVHFVIKFSDSSVLRSMSEEELDKKFKISSMVSLGNCVAFDSLGKIRKYNETNEIMEEFYSLRLQFYQKRKEFLTKKITEDWKRADNKVRFVKEIISGKLIIQKKKKVILMEELKQSGYDAFSTNFGEVDAEDSSSVGGSSGGYEYLLSMPLWSLTFEKIAALEESKLEKERELNTLLSLTPKDLWIVDLEDFLKELLTIKDFSYHIKFAENISGVTTSNTNSKPVKKGLASQKNTLDNVFSRVSQCSQEDTALKPTQDMSHLSLTDRIQMMLKRPPNTIKTNNNSDLISPSTLHLISPSPLDPLAPNMEEKLSSKISRVVIGRNADKLNSAGKAIARKKNTGSSPDSIISLPPEDLSVVANSSSKRKQKVAMLSDSEADAMIITKRKSPLIPKRKGTKKAPIVSSSEEEDQSSAVESESDASDNGSASDDKVFEFSEDDDNLPIVNVSKSKLSSKDISSRRPVTRNKNAVQSFGSKPIPSRRKTIESEESQSDSELVDKVPSKHSANNPMTRTVVKSKSAYKIPSDSENEESLFSEEDTELFQEDE